MPAHLNVTSTYGVVLPVGAEAQKASKTESIEVSTVMGGNGEFVKADSLHHKKVEVNVSYVGEPMHSSIAAGAIADPSTVTVVKSDATEQNNGRVSCSVTANANVAYADAGTGASPGAGIAGPDEDTLNLVSTTLSLGESVNVSKGVDDKMALSFDGTPGVRGRVTKKNTFGVRWKGDVPTGVALGLGGVGVFGLTTGKLFVLKLMEDQTNNEFNGGSADGDHYPVAA